MLFGAEDDVGIRGVGSIELFEEEDPLFCPMNWLAAEFAEIIAFIERPLAAFYNGKR